MTYLYLWLVSWFCLVIKLVSLKRYFSLKYLLRCLNFLHNMNVSGSTPTLTFVPSFCLGADDQSSFPVQTLCHLSRFPRWPAVGHPACAETSYGPLPHCFLLLLGTRYISAHRTKLSLATNLSTHTLATNWRIFCLWCLVSYTRKHIYVWNNSGHVWCVYCIQIHNATLCQWFCFYCSNILGHHDAC